MSIKINDIVQCEGFLLTENSFLQVSAPKSKKEYDVILKAGKLILAQKRFYDESFIGIVLGFRKIFMEKEYVFLDESTLKTEEINEVECAIVQSVDKSDFLRIVPLTKICKYEQHIQ